VQHDFYGGAAEGEVQRRENTGASARTTIGQGENLIWGTAMARYTALLRNDAANNFCVTFPDFPGCGTAGSTLEEARSRATEVLARHVESLLGLGNALPIPLTFDDVMAGGQNRDSFCVVIELENNIPAVERINVAVPLQALRHIDRAVEVIGGDRSSFLLQAALEKAGQLAGPDREPHAAEIALAYRKRMHDAKL
jgi:predicted RNase H-like HicB family nuclease